MLRGERVYLRPVRQEDLPLLAERANDLAYLTEYNFFGLSPNDQMEQGFREDGLLGVEHGTLIVATCEADENAGDISYRRVWYGPGAMSAAYNIGISLTPDQRGKGYGAEAQRLLAAYLFAVYPIMRVEASTDSANLPEQHALERAGFTREGTARQAQWRNGAWHDLVSYSKLRGE